MAHRTQIAWCKKVKKAYPEYFSNKRVLDIGSLDVNGNNKGLFQNCDYVGVDIIEGKNVDVVSIAHEYEPEELFDVVLSTNSFEHDMYFELTLKKMFDLLKPAGLMFCCGSSGHKEHGTLKRNAWASGTTQINNDEWARYYRNLTTKDFADVLNPIETFSVFSLKDVLKDVRFVGIKRSDK
jgi:SAM-dependent methyltransferase